MAISERQIRTAQQPHPEQAGIIASKLNVDYLSKSYARLYAYKSKADTGAGHPHPSNLTTKDAFVKAISNWALAHCDADSSAECSTCNGPMDLKLIKDGIIPSACIFCGDTDVEDEEFSSSPKSEPPPSNEDEPSEPDDDVIEADAEPSAMDVPWDEGGDTLPESGKVPAAATKPKGKVKKVKAKKEPKAGTVAAKTKDGKLVKAEPEATAKGEVLDKETKQLLDDVEKVRTGLSTGVQGVYSEMWSAGKFFAEIQKSKAWSKHPSAFTTWKAFVEGCFGVLVNVKRVEELVVFFKSNKEVPRLDGGLKLPQLPKVRNPQPRSREPREPETGPQFDPKNISIAGVFAKRQRLPFVTEKGKPAKTIKDRPICFLKSDNGVTIKFTIGQNPKSELVAIVTIDRE